MPDNENFDIILPSACSITSQCTVVEYTSSVFIIGVV